MKIYLGTDHAGFTLKNSIRTFLESKPQYEVVDKGAFEFDEKDDYPDYIMPVAKSVAEDRKNGIESVGIVFGGSGQGEMMAANRIKGIRCAVYCFCASRDILFLSRTHNDANMLSLGARFVTEEDAKEAIMLWLTTEFSGDERHERRNKKLDI